LDKIFQNFTELIKGEALYPLIGWDGRDFEKFLVAT
jgi:hypothetical protein